MEQPVAQGQDIDTNRSAISKGSPVKKEGADEAEADQDIEFEFIDSLMKLKPMQNDHDEDIENNANDDVVENRAEQNASLPSSESEQNLSCSTGFQASRKIGLHKHDVTDLIQADLYCCDLLWCLFVAAAKSYRFSSVLRPFPPMYQNGDEKNMFALKNAISSVPQLSTDPKFWPDLPSECQKLLSWLYNTGHFELHLKEKESTFKAIKEMTGQIMDTPEPSFVFEVTPSDQMDEKFEQLRNGRKCFFAYHGSRFDNFFSILHNGLNTHLNKVSVFGEGTYLSSELSVSLMYSQAGEGSRHSLLGTKLACVAVCQMIDDPSVKCQIKEGSAVKQKVRAQASKVTDKVPEKYYVVQRNDILRVKYLLVYKEESSQVQLSPAATGSSSWIRDNKFTLLMVAYVLLLVAIGIANSRPAMIYLTRFWKNMKWS